MKLKTIKKQAENIQSKTGIDFSQYRDEAWSDQLSELVRFPQYALKTLIQPAVLLIVLVIIVAIVCFNTGHAAFGGIFLLTGILLAIPNGILLGIIYFIFSITGDVHRLLELTLQKVRLIAEQLGMDGNKQQRKAKLAELAQGVLFSMLLPDLNRVVKKSIPLVGGIVAAILGSLLKAVSHRLEQRLTKMPEPDVLEEALAPKKGKRLAALDKVESGSESLTQGIAKVVSSPFFIVWIIIAALSAMIIYMEYQALF